MAFWIEPRKVRIWTSMVNSKDGLSMEVDELLRKLYETGADWLVVDNGRRWPIHKDKLVSLIGMGLGEWPIKSILEKKSSCLRTKDVDSISERFVLLSHDGVTVLDGESADLPLWWEVPIPVVRISKDGVEQNTRSEKLFGEMAISKKDIALLLDQGEAMVSCGGSRLFISRLEGDFFTVEDVSGDLSLAEDLGWWASVGKALWERLLDKGFKVTKKDRMDQVEDSSELVTCRWDRDVLGYLEIIEPRKTRRKSAGRTDQS